MDGCFRWWPANRDHDCRANITFVHHRSNHESIC
jgi:hypothetical protein